MKFLKYILSCFIGGLTFAADISHALIINQICKDEAGDKVERSARFPHFVQGLAWRYETTELNKILFNEETKDYTIHIANQIFTTPTLAMDKNQEKVYWPGVNNSAFFRNCMVGYLGEKNKIENIVNALREAENVFLRLTPDGTKLFSIFKDPLNDHKQRIFNYNLLDTGSNETQFECDLNTFDISLDSKTYFGVGPNGFLYRGGSGHDLQPRFHHLCCGQNSRDLLGLSKEGAHFIKYTERIEHLTYGFTKRRFMPSIKASLSGTFINIWRGKENNIFIVQDTEDKYHELQIIEQ